MVKLGQNFLKSKQVVNEIIDSAEISKSDIVLEIGPGKGILTEALLEHAKKVIAIEKDFELYNFLKEKFANQKNLELILGDILSFENNKSKIKNYKIVANIPYYITGAIIKKFLSSDNQPSLIVLMIQKEVAGRIVAKDNKPACRQGRESILSISVKAYGHPKIIKKVPAGCFSPTPKVDSAILKINNISKEFFKDIQEEKFFKLVKKGFSQKRKMLKNNLGISSEFLEKIKMDPKVRAQKLSLEDWKKVLKQLHSK